MFEHDLAGKRVWVVGHNGMVGSALVRRLRREDCEIVTVSRQDLDLQRQSDVENWLDDVRPDVVFMAAARVGGILANETYPAEFLYQNLVLTTNVIDAAYRVGVGRLLFLGSSCIYPKLAPQPIPENALLTGPLEPTNEAYAIAKIAGVKLCQFYRKQYGVAFFSAMPTNLFGPGDNFDLASSHVVPALLRKVHEAKQEGRREVVVWGTGTPRREFLYVDDCADALVHLMKMPVGSDVINVGSGADLTIRQLTELIMQVVGFEGEVAHDLSKPDGTPQKLMSADLLRSMGWSPKWSLEDGLRATYEWFLAKGAPSPEDRHL